VTLESYVLANLTARWQVNRALAVVGRVENLLDEQYELAHTFNTPDRGLYVSVQYAPGHRAAAATVAAAPRDAAGARGAYSPGGRAGREQTWVID
jgi:outer membrane receptor protein involved in Fe transport